MDRRIIMQLGKKFQKPNLQHVNYDKKQYIGHVY